MSKLHLTFVILSISGAAYGSGNCPAGGRAELISMIGNGCQKYSCEMTNPLNPSLGKSHFSIDGLLDGKCSYNEHHAQIAIVCNLSKESMEEIAAASSAEKAMQDVVNASGECEVQVNPQALQKQDSSEGGECAGNFQSKMISLMEGGCKSYTCTMGKYEFSVGEEDGNCVVTRANSNSTRKCPVPSEAMKRMAALATQEEKEMFLEQNLKQLCQMTETTGEAKTRMLALDLKVERENYQRFMEQESNLKESDPSIYNDIKANFDNRIKELEAQL